MSWLPATDHRRRRWRRHCNAICITVRIAPQLPATGFWRRRGTGGRQRRIQRHLFGQFHLFISQRARLACPLCKHSQRAQWPQQVKQMRLAGHAACSCLTRNSLRGSTFECAWIAILCDLKGNSLRSREGSTVTAFTRTLFRMWRGKLWSCRLSVCLKDHNVPELHLASPPVSRNISARTALITHVPRRICLTRPTHATNGVRTAIRDERRGLPGGQPSSTSICPVLFQARPCSAPAPAAARHSLLLHSCTKLKPSAHCGGKPQRGPVHPGPAPATARRDRQRLGPGPRARRQGAAALDERSRCGTCFRRPAS